MMARLWESHNLAARARASRRRRLLGENAMCVDCGESDAVVLKRESTGEVVCFRCRALRKAPAREGPWWTGVGSCTICNYSAPYNRDGAGLFERHHTAGRANLPGHTTLLCLNCHAKVSAAQRALGVDLSEQPDQRSRYAQSFNAVFSEVSVGIACVSERMPATWWQGFKDFTPTLLDAVIAMLEVACFAPEEGPEWTF